MTPGKSSRRSIICIACWVVACWVTGIGWYGEPFQQGCGVLASHSRTLFLTSSAGTPRTSASRVSTALPWSFCCISAVRDTDTTSLVSLPARIRPEASRISPRTAGSTTSRMWLPWALALNSLPLRICRYHSRPPRVASSDSTRTCSTTSRIVTRRLRPVSGMLLTCAGSVPTQGRLARPSARFFLNEGVGEADRVVR